MRILTRFLITCLLSTVILCIHAQNRYWVFPPNYVDFYTGQVSPLPNTAISPATSVSFADLIGGSNTTIPGNSLNKNLDYLYSGYRTANGIFDEDGDLKFYLNNKVYVTHGKTILYTSAYSDQLLTIPIPGECNKYFLLTGKSTGSGNTYLAYKSINQDGTSVVNMTLTIPTPFGGYDLIDDIFVLY